MALEIHSFLGSPHRGGCTLILPGGLFCGEPKDSEVHGFTKVDELADLKRQIDELKTELAEAQQKLMRLQGPVAKPTMQNLIDAGLNGFAFELVSESLAGKKDIKTFSVVRFEFRGVIYTLEPAKEPMASLDGD